MNLGHTSTINKLLEDHAQGDEKALRKLAPVVYQELRRIARAKLRSERSDHTLQPTALVNEVFVRLIQVKAIQWNDQNHFFSMAAQMMRRILVSYARSKGRSKRGGGFLAFSFDEKIFREDAEASQFLELDEALKKLSEKNDRQGKIVSLRFFTGLTLEEIAGVLKVSHGTVKRDWLFARAWLYRELNKK